MRCQRGLINAKIVRVIADRGDARDSSRRGRGLPTAIIDGTVHGARAAFEAAVADVIGQRGAQLVVLAGFMRILSARVHNGTAGRML